MKAAIYTILFFAFDIAVLYHMFTGQEYVGINLFCIGALLAIVIVLIELVRDMKKPSYR